MSEIIVYEETKSPIEVKDYQHDWTPDLGEGETVASADSDWIDTAGTAQASLQSVSPYTRISLTGGTHGQRALFRISMTTSANRVFDQLFAIDIVDPALSAGTLIVEDGTAKADANSFVSIIQADNFWRDRNDEAWRKASPAEKGAALRNAADYLTFGYIWPGQPTKTTQALPWPRAGAVDINGLSISTSVIPEQVRRAQHFLAREALSVDIMRQTDPASVVQSESVSVGGVSRSRTYDTGNRKPMQLHSFTHVDAILAGLAKATVGRGGFRSVPLRTV